MITMTTYSSSFRLLSLKETGSPWFQWSENCLIFEAVLGLSCWGELAHSALWFWNARHTLQNSCTCIPMIWNVGYYKNRLVAYSILEFLNRISFNVWHLDWRGIYHLNASMVYLYRFTYAGSIYQVLNLTVKFYCYLKRTLIKQCYQSWTNYSTKH